MEYNNPNNKPVLISEKIKALFEELSPLEQRICLQQLSDELDITLNFDLVAELRMRIKKLETQQGKLESYIEELEHQKGVIAKNLQCDPKKMTFEEMFASFPKEERKEMKKRIVTAKYYKLIAQQLEEHKAHIRRLQDANSALIAQNIQLKKACGQ